MFSSLKLSNLRGRKPGEVDQLVTSGPPHLDLTSPPSKKPPHPIVTTNRRSHKQRQRNKLPVPAINNQQLNSRETRGLGRSTNRHLVPLIALYTNNKQGERFANAKTAPRPVTA
ncbi:hypothetical protein J6590_049929, partial [Homalodisca vitripennis]